MFIESLTVDEFTIGQIRSPQELDLIGWFLREIFPTREPDPCLLRDRLDAQPPMMLAAKRDE